MKRWNSTLEQRTPLKRSPMNKISKKQKIRMANLAKIEPPEDGLCEKCHKAPDFRGLAKHHKVFRSHNGSDDKSNLIWLCGKCHSEMHGIIEKC